MAPPKASKKLRSSEGPALAGDPVSEAAHAPSTADPDDDAVRALYSAVVQAKGDKPKKQALDKLRAATAAGGSSIACIARAKAELLDLAAILEARLKDEQLVQGARKRDCKMLPEYSQHIHAAMTAAAKGASEYGSATCAVMYTKTAALLNEVPSDFAATVDAWKNWAPVESPPLDRSSSAPRWEADAAKRANELGSIGGGRTSFDELCKLARILICRDTKVTLQQQRASGPDSDLQHSFMGAWKADLRVEAELVRTLSKEGLLAAEQDKAMLTKLRKAVESLRSQGLMNPVGADSEDEHTARLVNHDASLRTQARQREERQREREERTRHRPKQEKHMTPQAKQLELDLQKVISFLERRMSRGGPESVPAIIAELQTGTALSLDEVQRALALPKAEQEGLRRYSESLVEHLKRNWAQGNEALCVTLHPDAFSTPPSGFTSQDKFVSTLHSSVLESYKNDREDRASTDLQLARKVLQHGLQAFDGLLWDGVVPHDLRASDLQLAGTADAMVAAAQPLGEVQRVHGRVLYTEAPSALVPLRHSGLLVDWKDLPQDSSRVERQLQELPRLDASQVPDPVLRRVIPVQSGWRPLAPLLAKHLLVLASGRLDVQHVPVADAPDAQQGSLWPDTLCLQVLLLANLRGQLLMVLTDMNSISPATRPVLATAATEEDEVFMNRLAQAEGEDVLRLLQSRFDVDRCPDWQPGSSVATEEAAVNTPGQGAVDTAGTTRKTWLEIRDSGSSRQARDCQMNSGQQAEMQLRQWLLERVCEVLQALQRLHLLTRTLALGIAAHICQHLPSSAAKQGPLPIQTTLLHLGLLDAGALSSLLWCLHAFLGVAGTWNPDLDKLDVQLNPNNHLHLVQQSVQLSETQLSHLLRGGSTGDVCEHLKEMQSRQMESFADSLTEVQSIAVKALPHMAAAVEQLLRCWMERNTVLKAVQSWEGWALAAEADVYRDILSTTKLEEGKQLASDVVRAVASACKFSFILKMNRLQRRLQQCNDADDFMHRRQHISQVEEAIRSLQEQWREREGDFGECCERLERVDLHDLARLGRPPSAVLLVTFVSRTFAEDFRLWPRSELRLCEVEVQQQMIQLQALERSTLRKTGYPLGAFLGVVLGSTFWEKFQQLAGQTDIEQERKAAENMQALLAEEEAAKVEQLKREAKAKAKAAKKKKPKKGPSSSSEVPDEPPVDPVATEPAAPGMAAAASTATADAAADAEESAGTCLLSVSAADAEDQAAPLASEWAAASEDGGEQAAWSSHTNGFQEDQAAAWEREHQAAGLLLRQQWQAPDDDQPGVSSAGVEQDPRQVLGKQQEEEGKATDLHSAEHAMQSVAAGLRSAGGQDGGRRRGRVRRSEDGAPVGSQRALSEDRRSTGAAASASVDASARPAKPGPALPWTCHKCGHVNPAGLRNCRHVVAGKTCCTNAPAETAGPVTPLATGDWQCPGCSQRHPPDAANCTRCHRVRPATWSCAGCSAQCALDCEACTSCAKPGGESRLAQLRRIRKAPEPQSQYVTSAEARQLWTCPMCQYGNLLSRDQCRRCQAPRSTGGSVAHTGSERQFSRPIVKEVRPDGTKRHFTQADTRALLQAERPLSPVTASSPAASSSPGPALAPPTPVPYASALRKSSAQAAVPVAAAERTGVRDPAAQPAAQVQVIDLRDGPPRATVHAPGSSAVPAQHGHTNEPAAGALADATGQAQGSSWPHLFPPAQPPLGQPAQRLMSGELEGSRQNAAASGTAWPGDQSRAVPPAGMLPPQPDRQSLLGFRDHFPGQGQHQHPPVSQPSGHEQPHGQPLAHAQLPADTPLPPRSPVGSSVPGAQGAWAQGTHRLVQTAMRDAVSATPPALRPPARMMPPPAPGPWTPGMAAGQPSQPIPPGSGLGEAFGASGGSDDEVDLNSLLQGLGVSQSEPESLPQLPSSSYSTFAAPSTVPPGTAGPWTPAPERGAPSWAARVKVPEAATPFAQVQADEENARERSRTRERLEQEEADQLRAAIQASLEEPQHPPVASQGAQGIGRTGRVPADIATPGLQNETGEYNCFLNVIIQCLWHCREFRACLLEWKEEAMADDVQANGVVAALVALFDAFEQQEQAATRDAGEQAGVVAPTRLREALSALPGQLFRIGEMNDAAEVLNVLYENLNIVSRRAFGSTGSRTLVDRTFGLDIQEKVHCNACGKDTHANRYTTYFFNASATALRLQALASETVMTTGELLRAIEQQHRKTCDTDEGGCGTMNGVQQFMESQPRVFTLQLAWESQHESSDDIAATLEGIHEALDLSELFLGQANPNRFLLRSMVCYYGAHYHALVLEPSQRRWLLFDDSSISAVGDWAAVQTKCQLGRIQPSVLFYESEGSQQG